MKIIIIGMHKVMFKNSLRVLKIESGELLRKQKEESLVLLIKS